MYPSARRPTTGPPHPAPALPQVEPVVITTPTPPMTTPTRPPRPPLQDDWDPGRRLDATRMRTDRRRVGWREFRHSYPGLIVTMTLAVAIFLAADAWLFLRYRRYVRET